MFLFLFVFMFSKMLFLILNCMMYYILLCIDRRIKNRNSERKWTKYTEIIIRTINLYYNHDTNTRVIKAVEVGVFNTIRCNSPRVIELRIHGNTIIILLLLKYKKKKNEKKRGIFTSLSVYYIPVYYIHVITCTIVLY